MKNRYLTKGRFKLGLECPTKLYYVKHPDYEDQQQSDPFMQALAKGGYQVGELAKYKYCEDPNGQHITIETLDEEDALRLTSERLMGHSNVVIAEGAFRYENLFIRADIVIREDNVIKLIEVKSKSVSQNDEFLNKKLKPKYPWGPYLYDVAFQTYVLEQALPGFEIRPYLLLANKDAVSTRDGLNQLFRVRTDARGRLNVVVEGQLTASEIGNFDLLREVPMRNIVNRLFEIPVPNDNVPVEYQSLKAFIHWSAERYETQTRHWSKPSKTCKSCSFKRSVTEKKCGFTECWTNHQWNIIGNIPADSLSAPKITDLCLERGGRDLSGRVWAQNVPFVSMIIPDQLRTTEPKTSIELSGMDAHQRRVFQIEASRQKRTEYIFLKDVFESMYDTWVYPFNMIDFETTTVALPYFKGMAPYESLAFQFSHHIMYADGRVEHHNDFISWEQGQYPNLEFIRALKKSLSVNSGSIFRYANHENAILNAVKEDISFLNPEDADELIAFIDEITQEQIDKKSKRKGSRNMIDLAEVVRAVYYSPHSGGSNSIKKILPAIIHDCPSISLRYSDPGLYGKQKPYTSRNFEQHIWITEETGQDPYKTLPSLEQFEGFDESEMDDELDSVADGGAAMMAYNKLQWSYITDEERVMLKDALLRYCELDTLAMVMLMQGLKSLENREAYE
jgi:hypothetical protein